MNSIHKRRLTFFSLLLCGLGLAIGLILFALKQNINVFLTPSELSAKKISNDHHFRLGGMVKKGSVVHEDKDLGIHFIVTDFKHDVSVHYKGVLPDLFREGKGVIATGKLNVNGTFMANEILAKHDENYMPKNMMPKDTTLTKSTLTV